jgi:hypothetical protein
MKKIKEPTMYNDDMKPEYDFAGGERGRYAHLFPRDTIAVVLDPEIAEAYPDSQSVNRALHAILKAAPARRAKTKHRTA